MSDRWDWQGRIKAVERQYAAARFATEHLRKAARKNPTILQRAIEPWHIVEASEHLESTYLIRLFAEFESGLRDYWRVARPGHHPRTRHLLDNVAANRGIPDELLVSAHAVRNYRNGLVHEQAEDVMPIQISNARSYLCTYLSRLPSQW